MKIPSWVVRNIPTAVRAVEWWLSRRRVEKLRKMAALAVVVALVPACGFKIPPCIKDGSCIPIPSPSPIASPSPSPSPTPTPEPSPTPTPEPSPSPSPVPTPSPSTSPSPGTDPACVLGADGNYPVPPAGTCPACWRKDPNLIAYWGVAFRSKTPCSGPSCPYGIKINVDITPHSAKPYLRHRQESGGGGTDTWEGCQPCADPANPECRAAIPEIWVYPPNAEGGLCDPFSGSLYWCHHKPQAGQGGKTRFEVHAPPFRSIEVDVP